MKKTKLITSEHKNEILGIVFFAITILVFISLVSYDQNDLSFYSTSPNPKIRNFAGKVGAYLAGGLVFLVGASAYIFPFLTFCWALCKFWGKRPQKLYVKSISTLILVVALSSLLGFTAISEPDNQFRMGGVVGLFFSDYLWKYFGPIGTYVVLAALILLSLLLATEFVILPFLTAPVRGIGGVCRLLWRKALSAKISLRRSKPPAIITRDFPEGRRPPRATRLVTPEPRLKREAIREQREQIKELRGRFFKPKIIQGKPAPPEKKLRPEKKPLEKMPAPQPEPTAVGSEAGPLAGYNLPPLELLDSPPPIEERKIKDDLEKNSRILEETLLDFGIEVRVTQVEQGPIITRYELEPAPGVKITRIVSLSDDIALAMKATSVRVVAPIPGKARVGVEVPNTDTTLVYLREILEADEFRSSQSKLTLGLGKDVSGAPLVFDLTDMPHLLIAGTTGSGKTVCVNALISSLLYNSTPDELKFLMVDPKMVELAIFNGLPHLLCPVLTEPRKVSGALSWVVSEMENRYKLLAGEGVRNIELYNEKAKMGKIEPPVKLPYILLIIDELADLMLVASVEIENAITRLAQLSRAVGIHIILATQRPSVDVITGVIKANFPARISFKVATKVDSRTVLDMNGADKLLGKGDLLFLRPGTSKPIRAQGSLVSDGEIEKIVEFIKRQRRPAYEESISSEQQRLAASSKDFEKDPLYDEALKLVLETGQASVSMLQRRLRLSHIRAARIVDMMEEEGVVGPYQGPKPREILIDREAVEQNRQGRPLD